jgi:hypothetical protein
MPSACILTTAAHCSPRLQAFDDAELPPKSAVSNASIEQLGVDFWGKRTMTNDFAHVVHRIKALGEQCFAIQQCSSSSSTGLAEPLA